MAQQKNVQLYVGGAVAGDFASENPHSTVFSIYGGFMAGQKGAVIGSFAWETTGTNLVESAKPASNSGRIGFVGRFGNMGVIYDPRVGASMTINESLPVTMYKSGDFFAVSKTDAEVGYGVYANNLDGTIQTAATPPASGFTDTGFKVTNGGDAGSLITISA